MRNYIHTRGFFWIFRNINLHPSHFFAMPRNDRLRRIRVLQPFLDTDKIAAAVTAFCTHPGVQRATKAATDAFDSNLMEEVFTCDELFAVVTWSGSLKGKRDETSYGNKMFKAFAETVKNDLKLSTAQVATLYTFRRNAIAPSHARNTKRKLVSKAMFADSAFAEVAALKQELETARRENEVLRLLLRKPLM